MNPQAQVDYDALAAQARGSATPKKAAPVDYDALAAQARQAQAQTQAQAPAPPPPGPLGLDGRPLPFSHINKAGIPVYQGTPASAGRYTSNAPAAPPPDWRTPLTKIHPHGEGDGSSWLDSGSGDIRDMMTDPLASTRELIKSFANIGGSGLSMALHPVYTAKSIVRQLADSPQAITEMANQAVTNPLETAEGAIGQAGVTEGLGEAIPKVLQGARSAAENSVRRLAGTGTGVARDLVRKTADKNADIVRDNATAQAEAQRTWENKQAEADAAHRKKLIDLRQKFEDDVRKGAWDARVGTAEDQKAFWDKRRAAKEAYGKAVNDQVEKYTTDKAKAEKANADARAEFVRKEIEARRGDAAKSSAEDQKQVLARGQQTYAQKAMANARQTFQIVKDHLDSRWDTLRERLGGQSIGGGHEIVDGKRKPIGSDAIEQSIEKAKDEFLMGAPDSVKQFNDLMSTMTEASPDDPFPKIRPLSWQEARVHYTALGDKLYSGEIPGNVRKAVELVRDTIDEQLQRVAKKNKLDGLYNSTREDWGQFKKDWDDMSNESYSKSAMGEAGSPLARLVRAADPEAAARALSNDRIMEQLARYKQHGASTNLAQGFRDLGKRLDKVDKVAAPTHPDSPRITPVPTAADYKPPVKPSPVEAKMPPPLRKPPKPLPPDELFKSAPVVPYKEPTLTPTRRISAEDMQRANENSFRAQGHGITSRLTRWAAIWPAFRMLSELSRTGETSLRPLAALPAAGAAGMGVESLLEHPGVREFFTRPTRAQLAAIPPELRGQMPEIVEAARSRGVHISPLIAAYAATIQRNRGQGQSPQQQQPALQGVAQ